MYEEKPFYILLLMTKNKNPVKLHYFVTNVCHFVEASQIRSLSS